MILLPLEGGGTRGDQIANAAEFEALGSALVLSGKEANADTLFGAIAALVGSPADRERMSAASGRMASIDAAESIARKLLEEIGSPA
jgi:UDP-N-acetylglucosamine--N-acetylmuramyl-(pentapeptide) pyrophosphoryl-undecaprenol N-acetylglucosamine transferase